MTLNPTSFLYTVDVASGVATITLNRPERLNALTFQVYTELRDTFRALDGEPGVRAVVITGAGRAFCTGGDVEDIIGKLFARDAAGLLEFTRLTGDLILSIRQCRRPVVAALNGTVAGAGAVIAAASDIRVAAEGARIAFLFSKVGLAGADMGAAWLLPRIVGLSHASELLMLGEFITAQRAGGAPDGRGHRDRRPAGPRAIGGARGHQAGAQRGSRDGSRERDRMGGPGPGRLHAAPQLPRGVPSLPCQARAQVRVAMPDCRPIRSFLEPSHEALASRASRFVADAIVPRAEPADDAAARTEARALLGVLGGGWQQPILDLDLRGCCLMREALAQVSPLADAVFALQGLGTTAILLGGSAVQKDRWLGPIARGDAMTAFAMTEPGAGSDVASVATTAARDGSGYVLNGRKTLISNAGIADVYAVFASTDPAKGSKGISCFLVPADTPGFRFVAAQVLSAPHPLGELAFEDCRVPADALLGAEGRGYGLGLATLDRLRPTVAAAACGMATRALSEALAHVRQRRQFGQPLAQFQLVQEKLARMATDLTAARLLTYRAAYEKDRGQERITTEAAMAKAFATEMAQRTVDDAVQLIGGQGVLAGHPVDRLYRSVRALRIYEGTTEIQQLIIAAELLKGGETTAV